MLLIRQNVFDLIDCVSTELTAIETSKRIIVTESSTTRGEIKPGVYHALDCRQKRLEDLQKQLRSMLAEMK